MTLRTSPAMNSQLSRPLRAAFSFAASTASSTISTPMTLRATGAISCAIVPVPLYRSNTTLSCKSIACVSVALPSDAFPLSVSPPGAFSSSCVFSSLGVFSVIFPLPVSPAFPILISPSTYSRAR